MGASSSSQTPRHWGIFLCCLLHGLLFSAAGIALPIRVGLGAVVLGGLGLAHLVVSALALWSSGPRLRWAFVNLGRLSLLAFLVVVAFSLHSASYVAELYGGLGRGIAAVIAAMLCVVALWTVPVGLWGISWSSRGLLGGLLGGWSTRVGGLALLAGVAMGMSAGRSSPVPDGLEAPDSAKLKQALDPYLSRVLPATNAPGQRDPGAWSCSQLAQEEAKGSVLVAFGYEKGIKQAQCLRIADLSELSPALEASGLRGLYRLDWITHQDPWNYQSPSWLAPVSLRPGKDGVCMQSRCLSAWQLVALDAYLSLRPVPSIPDLRFGVSPDALAKWVGAKPGSAATRITAQSYIVDRQGQVTTLARQRKSEQKPSMAQLSSVRKEAQDYILRAQKGDGGFEYMRQVYMDQRLPDQLNLPRQGGTLAALCEWGDQTPAVQHAISRALKALLTHEQGVGKGSVLWPAGWGNRGDLGSTALPLISLLKCRGRVQGEHDAVIGRLLTGLLKYQRPDGSFSPEITLPSGERAAGRQERLYAAGQAVLALLSALHEVERANVASWPEKKALEAAAKSAMDHYGGSYWTHLLSDFFFIEENWHCLAARESLGVLPHRGYEDFCLDYLKFKSRFTLRQGSRVDPAFLGGYGFGNLIVPQATPTAGQGEALSAGIAVLMARGEDATEQREELRSLLAFLWRQQLDEVNCRACVNEGLVRGGFTESMISPTIRIDYVQHVLSAFGAGLAVLDAARGEA